MLICSSALARPLVREQNTSLKMPLNPGTFGYSLVDGLRLKFSAPVSIIFPKNETNRLFVVELTGKIIIITNRTSPTSTTFLDLTSSTFLGPEDGLLAMAFHPDYESNGRFFVHRTVSEGLLRYNRISEFRVSATNPNVADSMELVLIDQPYKTHHLGGEIEFGPDGYLYGSFGDGGDVWNAQMIERDFFSAIWRIDIDNRQTSIAPNSHPASRGNYRIPSDNPFVGVSRFLDRNVDPNKIRTEFWSIGLRNPFRFSFDPLTGDLWLGDVGHESYESIFITKKGANHGWPYVEGTHPGVMRQSVPIDFLTNPKYQYVPPVYEYSHSLGHSVMGGVVYRGRRWSSLVGLYVFSDHSWGTVAAMKVHSDGHPEVIPLTYQPYITDFAVDPATGDIWVTELQQGLARRLEYSNIFTGDPLPPTLAQTGAFDDLETLHPSPGVVAYEVNQSFWSDDAKKRRWFSLPNITNTVTFSRNQSWTTPPGTIWVKHFDLEITNGVPTSSRRVETRLLVKNNTGAYGVTYRWDSSTNATLVPEEGLDEVITRVIDGKQVSQKWRFPSRAECLICHSDRSGIALSFNTAQLNRLVDYGSGLTNQLAALRSAGYLNEVPISLNDLPMFSPPADESASLEWRSRSYLAVNCSYCHQPGGAGIGRFDARISIPTASTGLVDGLLNNSRGDTNNRVLAPSDTVHSVAYQRMSARGEAQMPPLATSIIDPAGVNLLERWIAELGLPITEMPPKVTISHDGDDLHFIVIQPPNRAIRLERATDLDAGPWEPVNLPGFERRFWSHERTFESHVPKDNSPSFYRVVSESP